MDGYGKLVNPHTVVFERLLPGPIERVFQFLWDEDKRKLWFTSGAMPTQAGESFTQTWKHSSYSPNKSVPPERMKEMDEKGHSATNTLIAMNRRTGWLTASGANPKSNSCSSPKATRCG